MIREAWITDGRVRIRVGAIDAFLLDGMPEEGRPQRTLVYLRGMEDPLVLNLPVDRVQALVIGDTIMFAKSEWSDA